MGEIRPAHDCVRLKGVIRIDLHHARERATERMCDAAQLPRVSVITTALTAARFHEEIVEPHREQRRQLCARDSRRALDAAIFRRHRLEGDARSRCSRSSQAEPLPAASAAAALSASTRLRDVSLSLVEIPQQRSARERPPVRARLPCARSSSPGSMFPALPFDFGELAQQERAGRRGIDECAIGRSRFVKPCQRCSQLSARFRCRPAGCGSASTSRRLRRTPSAGSAVSAASILATASSTSPIPSNASARPASAGA